MSVIDRIRAAIRQEKMDNEWRTSTYYLDWLPLADLETLCNLADHIHALYYGKGYTGLVPPWAKEEFKEHDVEIGELLRYLYEE